MGLQASGLGSGFQVSACGGGLEGLSGFRGWRKMLGARSSESERDPPKRWLTPWSQPTNSLNTD